MSEPVSLDGDGVLRLQLLRELEEHLDRGFHGQIVLHCERGMVRKYELREFRTPRSVDTERSLD